MNISHQSSGLYTCSQLHLGLIFKVLLLVCKSLNWLRPQHTVKQIIRITSVRNIKGSL